MSSERRQALRRLQRRLSRKHWLHRPAATAVLLLLTGALAFALAVPATYETVMKESVRASYAGHTYAVTLRQGTPAPQQLRGVQNVGASATHDDRLVELALRVSEDPAFFTDLGITRARADPGSGVSTSGASEGSRQVALSEAAAQTLGVRPGDSIQLRTPDAPAAEHVVGRVFLLPAQPAVTAAAVQGEVTDAETVWTSPRRLSPAELNDLGDDAVATARDLDFRVMQLTEEVTVPRALEVAVTARAPLVALLAAFAAVTTLATRPLTRRREAAMVAAGATGHEARSVSLVAAWRWLGQVLAAGVLTGLLALFVVAPMLGRALDQVWLRGQLFALAAVPWSAIGGVLGGLLVGGLVAGVSVALADRLDARGRSMGRTAASVAMLLGGLLLVGAIAAQIYLWATQGNAPGWWLLGVLSPVAAAVGVALLLGVRPPAPTAPPSGRVSLRARSAAVTRPVTVLTVALAISASSVAGVLVTESVWGARNNPTSVAGGALEFGGVSSSEVPQMRAVAESYPDVDLTSALVDDRSGLMVALPPSAVACLRDAMSNPGDAFLQCQEEAVFGGDAFQQPAVGVSSDNRVYADSSVVEDGQVALAVRDESLAIVAVETRAAVTQDSLGGGYLPVATIPGDDPLAQLAGFGSADTSAVRVSGLTSLPEPQYRSLRGQLAFLAPTALIDEDRGFDDNGALRTGVTVAAIAGLLSSVGALVLVSIHRDHRRPWWHLVLAARRGRRDQLLHILPALGPAFAGVIIGMLFTPVSLIAMFDYSPLTDSRYVFLLPGMLTLLVLLATTLRLLHTQQDHTQ